VNKLKLIIAILSITITLPACVSNIPTETLAITEPAESTQAAKAEIINEYGTTIKERFLPPEGSERLEGTTGSFAEYLQNLKLKAYGEKVLYYDGREKSDFAYISVIDQDITERNLQQCADAIMRLKGEYHYAKGEFDKISFNFVSGFKCDFKTWSSGRKVVLNGNNASWAAGPNNDTSYTSFRRYMDVVHSYASTISLKKQLEPVDMMEMEIGDVFIVAGSPGHAVIVVDMAIEKMTGTRYFILAQSYMPAQETQVLKNLSNPEISPWYILEKGELITPQWTFPEGSLRRFPKN
jgi:hypothetical protein